MTTIKAQQIVQNARMHLVEQRMDGAFGDTFRGTLDYRAAWNLLFAAENLISDPGNYHYQAILSERVLPEGVRDFRAGR